MKDVDEISVTDDDMLMLSASDEITRASEMLGDETLCYELILKDKAYFNPRTPKDEQAVRANPDAS